jgi:hypothetical protein
MIEMSQNAAKASSVDQLLALIEKNNDGLKRLKQESLNLLSFVPLTLS